MGIAVYLAVLADDAFDSVFLCWPFSHEMSWMRSVTKLSQFLRGFLGVSYQLLSAYISVTTWQIFFIFRG